MAKNCSLLAKHPVRISGYACGYGCASSCPNASARTLKDSGKALPP